MYIEKSYKIKYIDDGKEVWAWLAPGVDPTQYNPIEQILVIVLKAEEGMTLVKDGVDVGPAVFLEKEEDKDMYSEKEAEDPIPPEPVPDDTKKSESENG